MHPKYAPYLFGLLLSGLMSLIVSGVAMLRAVGLEPNFVSVWMEAWMSAWLVAFPGVLVVAPVVRRIVARVTRNPDEAKA
ncbi:DUF2798 domain-containing protein [Acuticoccus yangtzensis]|uniref:DUF2798 domain-containing protein n=1 Tax=Acuticoccus yangtzensis TaxID=1443441 RepID=UPI0009498241|nr:DUF2798 domain-containing protein [Acuticoccus yangtzensis]ORE95535.1 hypothetical protein ATO13_01715 [Stappia sp. 22II-S9-Z10]